MRFLGLLLALCVVGYECKWGNSKRRVAIPDPPDHTKIIPMARYVLHNAGKYLVLYSLPFISVEVS